MKVSELNEWQQVFGHLSLDADEAGNILYQQRMENEEQLRIALESLNTILGMSRTGRVAHIWDIAKDAIASISKSSQ